MLFSRSFFFYCLSGLIIDLTVLSGYSTIYGNGEHLFLTHEATLKTTIKSLKEQNLYTIEQWEIQMRFLNESNEKTIAIKRQ